MKIYFIFFEVGEILVDSVSATRTINRISGEEQYLEFLFFHDKRVSTSSTTLPQVTILLNQANHQCIDVNIILWELEWNLETRIA